MDKLESILYKAHSHKDKNWLMSKVILENALKDFPNEKQLYIELGDLLSSKNLYKKAIFYYIEALKFNQNDDNLLFKIATNFLSIDEFGMALHYFLQIEKKNAETLYDIAYTYSRLGEQEKSIKILYDLIEKYETTEIPFLLLSEIYYSKANYDRALKILEKAEKKFGGSAAIYYLKASVYAQKELWLLAVNYYSKADKFNSKFPNFYRNYAIALYKLGYSDKALKFLIKNLEYHEKDDNTYFYLLKILIEQKKYNEARKYLQIAKNKKILAVYTFLKVFEMQLNHLNEEK